MFTYIDPSVRERLLDAGKLLRIDSNGQPISADVIRQSLRLAQSEISPIDDIRGSVRYKRLLLQQLLIAHFLKLLPQRLSREVLQ